MSESRQLVGVNQVILAPYDPPYSRLMFKAMGRFYTDFEIIKVGKSCHMERGIQLQTKLCYERFNLSEKNTYETQITIKRQKLKGKRYAQKLSDAKKLLDEVAKIVCTMYIGRRESLALLSVIRKGGFCFLIFIRFYNIIFVINIIIQCPLYMLMMCHNVVIL